MWLAVASLDAQRATGLLDASWHAHLEEGQRVAAAIVLDFDAPEMTCPACLTTFATGPESCPDCGLFIGS